MFGGGGVNEKRWCKMREGLGFVPGTQLLLLRFVPCRHHLVLRFVSRKTLFGTEVCSGTITRNLLIFSEG